MWFNGMLVLNKDKHYLLNIIKKAKTPELHKDKPYRDT